MQARQAHWNVRGPQSRQRHELFDDPARQVEEYVDLIAARATARSMQHVEALTVRFAGLAATGRSAADAATELGDAVSADQFTEVSRGLDRLLWFLETHLLA